MLPEVVGVAVELADGLDVNDWAEMRWIRRKWSAAASRYDTQPVRKAMTFWRQGNDVEIRGLAVWITMISGSPGHRGFQPRDVKTITVFLRAAF